MSDKVCAPTVFVVDDDPAMRDSLAWLLESVGLSCRLFGCASDFLAACDPEQPGCLLLDVRMPGMSGMELLQRLKRANIGLPVIILTGHGDVPMAVRAIQEGALDFLTKPYNSQCLLERVHEALERDRRARSERGQIDRLQGFFTTLTQREREIMEGVVAGKSSKLIARELGISPKTVDNHRNRVMKKLGVHNVAELVQTSLVFQLQGAGGTAPGKGARPS